MFNPRAGFGSDVRRLFSGKDTLILDEEGTTLATVDQFQAQANFTNATYQPLGSPIQQEFMTGYAITLTITQCTIEDDKFIRDVFDFFHVGRHAPMWTFQSTIFGYDGSESRYIFRDCVPTGQLDLHNFTVGDIIRRVWNLHANMPPEMLKTLTYPGNRRDVYNNTFNNEMNYGY